MIKINLNPKGLKTGDCVIRAIAYATNQTWEKVYTDLSELGYKMKRLPNEKQVYEKYLNNLGWVKYKQPRKYDNSKYTINELLKYKTFINRTIISVTSHLTCVDNFEIVDTWDCGRKYVCNYWIKL